MGDIMYISVNGMVFENYEDAMQYNRIQIAKEEEELTRNKMLKYTSCPSCGSKCLKSQLKEFYICKMCGAFMKGGVEDESEN